VSVVIFRRAAGGKVRFLRRDGTLSAPRSFKHMLGLRARGSGHWKLRLRASIAPGRYSILSIAFDSAHHRQLRSPTVVVRIR
jgi:hypothetical protein